MTSKTVWKFVAIIRVIIYTKLCNRGKDEGGEGVRKCLFCLFIQFSRSFQFCFSERQTSRKCLAVVISFIKTSSRCYWWLITDTEIEGKKQKIYFVLFIHETFSSQMREKQEENGKNRLAKQNFLTKNANKMQHLLSLVEVVEIGFEPKIISVENFFLSLPFAFLWPWLQIANDNK